MSEIREEYKTTTRNGELEQLGLNLRVVDVAALTPHPRNYNQHSEHSVGELGQSLGDFGQYKNMVAWTDPDNGVLYILAGHGLWEAAIARGDTRIAVNDRSDLTRAEAMALMVSDNLTPTTDFDYSILKGIVTDEEFPEDVPGLDDETLAGILEMAGVEGEGGGVGAAEPQIDRAAELQEIWGTELGQVWSLGDHKLACGDCTDERVVAAVMGGEKADAVVTDPPYGTNQPGVPGDEPETHRTLMYKTVANLPIADGVVIAFQSPRMFPNWLDAIRKNGFVFERMLWLYKAAQMTFPWRGWLLKSEAILVSSIGTPTWTDVSPNAHDCYYLSEVSNEIDDELGWHGSIKPLSVVNDLVSRVSEHGGIVFDPFLGSGTTLIACERLNRKCRAIEIDPRYVAVTLQRFLDATGKTPKLTGSI